MHHVLREVIDKLQTISNSVTTEPNNSVLDSLGRKRGTDKASGSHNYLHFYEVFLQSLRDLPITVLEIGVGSNNSLLMWADYFPVAKIVGMDIQDGCRQYHGTSDGRIHIEIGDQSSAQDLDRIQQAHGPFDVIVDDAGHHGAHQMSCFRQMLQYVKTGGFYILEDVGDRSVTELWGQIAREIVHGEDNTGLTKMCEYIACYRETSVIRRKG